MSSSFKIPNSLRFRAANSASMTRTPGAGTSRTTMTWSFWWKPSLFTASQVLFNAGTGGSADQLDYNGSANDGVLRFLLVGGTYAATATSAFRDPSRAAHINIILDTNDTLGGGAADRMRIYVDNVRQPTTNSNPGSGQQTGAWNTAVSHLIGWKSAGWSYADGYMSNFQFVDGQALLPTNFGMVDTATGIWVPKAYAGTFGTDGCSMNFLGDGTATATGIGADQSGNGNNWTPSGFSVTAGTSNDVVTDTPTSYGVDTLAGGEVRGNYGILSPLIPVGGATALSEGSLVGQFSGAVAYKSTFLATLGMRTGKWYWEYSPKSGTVAFGAGVNKGSQPIVTDGQYFDPNGYSYYNSGVKYNNNVSGAYGNSYTLGDWISFMFDADNGIIWCAKNGTLQNSATTAEILAATTTHAMYSGLTTGVDWFPGIGYGSSGVTGDFYVNFGQRAFDSSTATLRAALAGVYKTLCTQNYSTPSIVKSNTYFDVNTRTGTGSAFNVTGFAFPPDLVWTKRRDASGSHMIANSVRGTGKYASSDSTAIETSDAQAVTAFNSDGYSGGTAAILNTNTGTYVAWMAKKGALPGIDIVQYTGTTLTQNVSHALGVPPELIIVKRLTTLTENWPVYSLYGSAGATGKGGSLKLNTTAAYAADATIWNSTDPTNSVFTLGTSVESNILGETFEALLFASVPGFSKFGYYTGNGSADGPFVWCGFFPRYVMIKRTDVLNSWIIRDTARDPYNVAGASLFAESSAAESTEASLDFLANGFKTRGTQNDVNASSGGYIFAAFAKYPFKYSAADASGLYYPPMNPMKRAYLRR